MYLVIISPSWSDAVWPPSAFLIGGGLLLLAVEDVRVDGERLEGVGVVPTIEVRADPASVGLSDPQLIGRSQSSRGPNPELDNRIKNARYRTGGQRLGFIRPSI